VLACLKTAQPLQGCKLSHRAFLNPGFQSKPWADISQRFQRYKIFPPNLGRLFVQSTGRPLTKLTLVASGVAQAS
jgi:hypothetical protein